MTEQAIEQALQKTLTTMQRQRLLKQLWKLRNASVNASPATEQPAGQKRHPDGLQKRSA